MDEGKDPAGAKVPGDFWGYLDRLVAESKVVIEQSAGSTDPFDPDSVYPAAYGYLEGTSSMDGDGIDVWVGAQVAGVWRESGPRPPAVGVICTVDLLRRDSEIKILLGCSGPEIEAVLSLLNGTRHLRAWLVARP